MNIMIGEMCFFIAMLLICFIWILRLLADDIAEDVRHYKTRHRWKKRRRRHKR